MNEECSVLEDQNEDTCVPHHLVQTTPATSTEDSAPEAEETPLRGRTETATGIFADPCADPNSNSEKPDSEDQKSELGELRSELMQLRQQLEESHLRLAQMEHIERQYTEFCSLYPNTPISSLSEDVWKGVEKGNSLAAAFALAEHRRALSAKKASDSNTDNRVRSAGAVGNAESVEFSPAEVRAMSSTEVRANLSKIMRSMQKWHENK